MTTHAPTPQLALARQAFARRIDPGTEGLNAFIPRVSRGYSTPAHLAPLIAELERAHCEPVRLVCHAPPRHGKPLGKDTRITMSDGSLRPISALVVGDRVVSGAGRPTVVTAVYPQGVLAVSRVITRAGRTFLAEGSHRFLTQRDWVRVDQLRPYDRKAWQRPRGDYLQAGAQYETEPVPISTDVALFLGYMAGDGNTTQRNCRWTNVDPVVRARFERTVRALGGEVVEHDAQTLGINSGSGRSRRTVEEERAWRAQYERNRRANPEHREPRTMGGHHLKALLAKHGLDGKTAHSKLVPSSIFAAQPEAVAAFLAAYFECDGSRGVDAGERGATAAFYSVSRGLLEGCQALLARFGIRSSLYQKRGKYKGAEHFSWQLSIQDQARFFDVLPIVGAKAGAKTSSRRYERDSRLPDAVLSVEPAGVEECFCITVADDESFLAEGLITHNTESVLHAIAWYLRQRPSLVCGYATYGADLSYSKSRVARSLARTAGVELAGDAQGVKEWRTRAGGGLLATGVGGPFTGFGVNILFVDDPIKNRVEAESPAYRKNVIDWWKDVAFTRLEPNGSAIVFATRWHPEDLSGHLIRQGWRYIRLPAIDDAGAALWPERYDAAALDSIRRTVGEYTWASLFQGLPRPRGGSVFNAEPKLYTADALAAVLARPGGWRKAIGLDFAYSKKTSADHSAAVLGLGFVEDGRRMTYVLDCRRRQVVQPVFAREVAELQGAHPGATAMGYVSSIEKHAGGGVEAFFRGLGARIEARIAAGDKFVRAQPYAASWNDGRVLLPADVEADSWVNVFLAEHLNFTGADGEEDDQVDSGAAMHDQLNAAQPARHRAEYGADWTS